MQQAWSGWSINDSDNQYARACNIKSIGGLVTVPSLSRQTGSGTESATAKRRCHGLLYGFGWSPHGFVCNAQ